LLGLDKKTYELAGASPANVPGSYKDPGFGWMAGFIAAISFAGLLSLIPLRKVLFLSVSIYHSSPSARQNIPMILNGGSIFQGFSFPYLKFD